MIVTIYSTKKYKTFFIARLWAVKVLQRTKVCDIIPSYHNANCGSAPF